MGASMFDLCYQQASQLPGMMIYILYTFSKQQTVQSVLQIKYN